MTDRPKRVLIDAPSEMTVLAAAEETDSAEEPRETAARSAYRALHTDHHDQCAHPCAPVSVECRSPHRDTPAADSADPYAASPDAGDETACDCNGAWHARKQHCVDAPCPGCDYICPPEPGVDDGPHADAMYAEQHDGSPVDSLDTPGCNCGHQGMGAKWHSDDCSWRRHGTAASLPTSATAEELR